MQFELPEMPADLSWQLLAYLCTQQEFLSSGQLAQGVCL